MVFLEGIILDNKGLNKTIFEKKIESIKEKSNDKPDLNLDAMDPFFCEIIIESLDFILRCRREYLKNL